MFQEQSAAATNTPPLYTGASYFMFLEVYLITYTQFWQDGRSLCKMYVFSVYPYNLFCQSEICIKFSK